MLFCTFTPPIERITPTTTVANARNITTTPATGPDGFNYMNAATNTSLTRSDFDFRFLDVKPGRRHVPDPAPEEAEVERWNAERDLQEQVPEIHDQRRAETDDGHPDY